MKRPGALHYHYAEEELRRELVQKHLYEFQNVAQSQVDAKWELKQGRL